MAKRKYPKLMRESKSSIHGINVVLQIIHSPAVFLRNIAEPVLDPQFGKENNTMVSGQEIRCKNRLTIKSDKKRGKNTADNCECFWNFSSE
jgi:hypothetical protein